MRDPSHARALTLDELHGLYRAAGLGPPSETFWDTDVNVDGLLERSFPQPGAEPVIRRLFEESVADDAMGLRTRRDERGLCFTYSTVILATTRLGE